MNELSLLVILIGIVILVLVLYPFFAGEGGWLLDASKLDSVDKLKAKQRAILLRWIEDEQASESGMITVREWSMRQVYLTNRFVDTTRRLDWLADQEPRV
jgi:hypothetical protein